MAIDLIDAAFSPIYGKPCWLAQRGYSSFLTFEFGTPHLDIYEPGERPFALSKKVKIRLVRRTVRVHGEWHLWIYCCDWSIRLGGKQIAHSESSDRRTERAVGVLDGQSLTRVSVDPSNARSVFEFDLDGSLLTWPYDKDSEQWLLYEPSGYVLTVRADGRYSHQPGDTDLSQEQWHALASV